MPQPAHQWDPHELVDPEQLEEYKAYKNTFPGALRNVDLHESVGIAWFHWFQTNLMELEDTHIDVYLKILRKRQRAYPTVYDSRVNILDSQFYSLLDHAWTKIALGEDRIPPQGWSVLNHQWSPDELSVVRGELPLGNRP